MSENFSIANVPKSDLTFHELARTFKSPSARAQSAPTTFFPFLLALSIPLDVADQIPGKFSSEEPPELESSRGLTTSRENS